MKQITIETIINAPIETVWKYWTQPEHITQWCFASDDWEAPHAENDVRVGGGFKTTMAAKDKSTSFDFSGKYTAVKDKEMMEYVLDDGRVVSVFFQETDNGVKVIETFEAEDENSLEVQQAGWQAIMDNFKFYTESNL